MTNPLRQKFQALSTQPQTTIMPPTPSGTSDTALALLRAKLAGSQARVNPPEAKIADDALTPKTVVQPVASVAHASTASVPTSIVTSGTAHHSTQGRRARRTKAEMEAAAKSQDLGDTHEATYAHADAVEPLAGASVDHPIPARAFSLVEFSTEDLLKEVFRRIKL